jgi:DNA invertase Pin-like site-specific DNA recombinase
MKAQSTSAPTSAVVERSDKIQPRHLERLAIVYIRQSTLAQVYHNQESTKAQYGLVDTAQRLGWSHDRVLTIDEDQGKSGKTAEGRDGFQRLLREVAFDHVGIILGVEISRLSRSSKDWYHLLEVCARFGTLIADLDGLYDPSRYNDRLLLGLKGTMSEAELHVLRQRLIQGKINKAKRGELGTSVPSGYLRTQSGEIIIDPDEEVQAAVRLVFETFDRVGSAQGTLRQLHDRGVQIGVRLRTGKDIGRLTWHRVHRVLIINMLRHPIYTGAYVYGRRRTDPRKQIAGKPASGRTPRLPMNEWTSLVKNRYPAYISWEKYEENQHRLDANRIAPGPIRGGAALLQGIIRCGRCNHTMFVRYCRRGGKSYARYCCEEAKQHYGEKACSSLMAQCVDDLVSELVLEALRPGALEISLRVAEELEEERAKTDSLWQKRLQRARYEAERAERQYQAVEPENRLVARNLEKAWEEQLAVERSIQEEYHRHQAERPKHLSAKERDTIRQLANDIPTLWNTRSTTVQDKKTIVRLLIERVTVTVDHEWADVTVKWIGGQTTSRRIRRPVGRLIDMENHAALLAEIKRLRAAGYTADVIAQRLNADGWTTPMLHSGFNERLIQMFMDRYGRVPRGPKRPPSDDPSEWWIQDLAKKLRMPIVTLYGWTKRGWVRCRQSKRRAKVVVLADKKELERLQQLRKEYAGTGRRYRRRPGKKRLKRK